MRYLKHYALSIGIVMMLLFALSASAQMNPCNPCGSPGKTFTVDDARNVLTFESKAPLEKIVGTTNQIKATLQVDPNDILKTKAHFEVDLASMKTGIGLRDQHMREKYLETGTYPKAVLKIDKITQASSKRLLDQEPVTVDAEATLKLHGVSRKITLKGVKVTYLKESEATRQKMPGDLLHIEGAFTIRLPDYKVKVPKMLLLKLDENIKVNVDVFATTSPPKSSKNPCNPCGGEAANPCNPCGDTKAGNPCGEKNAGNPCNPCGG